VKGVVVDEIHGCRKDQFDVILGGIKASANRELHNRPPPNLRRDDDAVDEAVRGGLSLQYCLDDGGYYLRYLWYWDNKDIRDLNVITSISCRRKRHIDKEGPEWQTVMVSDRLRGRVWISPVFFEKPRYDKIDHGYSHGESLVEIDDNDNDNDEIEIEFEPFDLAGEHSHSGPVIVESSYLKEQALEIRIGVTVGFHSEYFTVEGKFTEEKEVGFTEIEAFGSRNFGSPYLPYPGGNTEPREDSAVKKAGKDRYWYRDTGTGVEDVSD